MKHSGCGVCNRPILLKKFILNKMFALNITIYANDFIFKFHFLDEKLLKHLVI